MARKQQKQFEIDEPVGIQAGDDYKVERASQFSEKDLLFESTGDLVEGQIISVSFQLSNTVLIRFDAEVVYIAKLVPGKKLISARFLDPQPNEIELLINFFERQRGL